MRYFASFLFCAIGLTSFCLGCDVSTSDHSSQLTPNVQTEISLTPTATVDEGRSSTSSQNNLLQLVSNKPSKLKTPQSPLPNTSDFIATNTPAEANQSTTPQSDQPKTDPTLKPQEKFRPPFTERTNVFTPPSSDQSVPTNEGEPSIDIAPVLDVSLKGFARVEDLRAILMIEDTIAPLGMGQEKQGIRIISIEPPKVTLERDDQRWSLTLSNQFSQSGNARSRRPGRD